MTLIVVVASFAGLLILLFTVGNALVASSQRPRVTKIVPLANCPGTFSQEIVGESHYQQALARIAGPKTEKGHNCVISALLVPNDNNPRDRLAIAVLANGALVGHLSRDDARALRMRVKGTPLVGCSLQLPGCIRGGWRRLDGTEGHYGIELDLPVGPLFAKSATQTPPVLPPVVSTTVAARKQTKSMS